MAKLYFRYGAMGSSKTANAIMVQYNYGERHQRVLMVKPQLENRDGERIIRSRSGLETECVFAEELEGMDLTGYDCVIVDEAQFLTKAQVEYLVHIVDDLGIPVIAYGLRADFKGNFFEGSQWLMAWADTIEEVKTICSPSRATLPSITRALQVAFLPHQQIVFTSSIVSAQAISHLLPSKKFPLKSARRP